MRYTLPILTFVVTSLLAIGWGYAGFNDAPKTTSGNSQLAEEIAARQPAIAGRNSADLPQDRLAQAEDPPKDEKTEENQPEKEPEQADSAPKAAPKAKVTASDVLAKAREMLRKHDSVRADVIETVQVANHSFKATGKYLQQGKMRMRLELDLRLGETTASMLEVCDGEILYSRQIIGETPQLTRRNVREILDEANKSNIVPAELFIAEMGLGGLNGLLASLDKSMKFDVLKDDTLDDRSVWMIRGTWKESMRNRLLPPEKPPQAAKNAAGQEQAKNAEDAGDKSKDESKPEKEKPRELPALVPDSVQIYLDRRYGFPKKIEYLKKVPNRNFARPMLTLAFRNVKLNETIDDSEFEFIPPDTPIPFDLTPVYKQRIQAAAQQAARKQQQQQPAQPGPVAPGFPGGQ